MAELPPLPCFYGRQITSLPDPVYINHFEIKELTLTQDITWIQYITLIEDMTLTQDMTLIQNIILTQDIVLKHIV